MHWYNTPKIRNVLRIILVSHLLLHLKKRRTIVTVIPESDPKAIVVASANNVSIPLTLASADHDCNFCQIVGTSPVIEQFNLRSIFNNRARNMCPIQEVRRVGLMVSTYQDYHEHDFPDLPRNLEGGISLYGLVPLQSIFLKKRRVEMQRHIIGWEVFM